MRSILLILLFTPSIFSFSQNKPVTELDGSTISFNEIDQHVKRLMDQWNIQGLSLAVLNNKNPVFIKSYGYRNKPANELMDTATIVYGASFSKAVFGYLVMRLVDEKVISLDKPLSQYLQKPIGEYEYFADLKNDDRWKLITARMCLSHTTGLPNVRWFNPITGESDTMGIMKIYFTPGSKYAYSGEGYKLLQLAIEEHTGKTTDQLAEEMIYRPFNMHRTGFVWHDSFGDDNVAVGHLNDGSLDKKRKRTEAVAGGSLVTSIADYTKFISGVMQQKGLTKKSFNEMVSPQIRIRSKTQFPPITMETTTEFDAINLSYGLGWGVYQSKYGKSFWKEGNGGSWRNFNMNFLDKGVSIIIMINSENGEKVFKELSELIIGDTVTPWKWEGYYPYD